MADPACLQLTAHDPRQRTALGLGKIGHGKAGGVQLVARTHGRNQGNACTVGAHGKLDLGRYGVHGVQNAIVSAERIEVGVLGKIKDLVCRYRTVGVDVKDPLAHDLYLGAPHGGVQSDDLTVDVGA